MWTAALLTSMVFIALPTFALSAKHTEEEKKEWQCGTDDVTKFLTESQIEFDCPNLKKRINKCCVEHDDCYSEQAGRKYCDDEFCQCLTVATRGSEICARENGPLLCHIVRELGEEPYRLSAPNATLAAVQNATVSTGNAQTLARHINVDRSLVRRNGSVDELHNETSPIFLFSRVSTCEELNSSEEGIFAETSATSNRENPSTENKSNRLGKDTNLVKL